MSDLNVSHQWCQPFVKCATSMKWCSTTGVLCNRCTNEGLKLYQSIVRLIAFYDSKYGPTIKEDKNVALSQKRNTLWSHPKLGQPSLLWGPIHCEKNVKKTSSMVENPLAEISLNIRVDGKRLKGRLKEQWPDALDSDLKAFGCIPAKWKNNNKVRINEIFSGVLNYWSAEFYIWKPIILAMEL